jgi:hypothetical protein
MVNILHGGTAGVVILKHVFNKCIIYTYSTDKKEKVSFLHQVSVYQILAELSMFDRESLRWEPGLSPGPPPPNSIRRVPVARASVGI